MSGVLSGAKPRVAPLLAASGPSRPLIVADPDRLWSTWLRQCAPSRSAPKVASTPAFQPKARSWPRMLSSPSGSSGETLGRALVSVATSRCASKPAPIETWSFSL